MPSLSRVHSLSPGGGARGTREPVLWGRGAPRDPQLELWGKNPFRTSVCLLGSSGAWAEVYVNQPAIWAPTVPSATGETCEPRSARGERTHLGKREAVPQARVAVEGRHRLHQRGEGQAAPGEQLSVQGHAGQQPCRTVVEDEVHGHGAGAAVDPPAGPEAAQRCVGCRPARWRIRGPGCGCARAPAGARLPPRPEAGASPTHARLGRPGPLPPVLGAPTVAPD